MSASSTSATQQLVEHVDTPSDVVRVVQLTDTHLCGEQGGTLLGMDTDHSLQAVIDQVQEERPGVDLLLGTGDLADNGAPDAYRRLSNYFSQFDCASFWLPGNHDSREAMENEDAGKLCREIRAAGWQLVMLDSQIPGEVGGELGEVELEYLDAALADAGSAGLHSLVCLHHHPVLIGSGWLDEQIVADAEAFFSVLDRHNSVRAVLWGHVHQEIERERGAVSLMATPSTCVQFAPGSEHFRADDLPPGYRWLDLRPDGGIDTGVSRVTDVEFHVDLDSGGYL